MTVNGENGSIKLLRRGDLMGFSVRRKALDGLSLPTPPTVINLTKDQLRSLIVEIEDALNDTKGQQ